MFGVALALGLYLGNSAFHLRTSSAEKEIKTVKTRIETVEIDKPIVEYKYKEKKVVVHDTIKEQYKYTFKQKDEFGDIEIKGWGDIESIKLNTVHTDSLIEKTITKNLRGFYLNGEYSRTIESDNALQGLKIGVDYITKDIIIGANVGVFDKTPIFGIRKGYKL